MLPDVPVELFPDPEDDPLLVFPDPYDDPELPDGLLAEELPDPDDPDDTALLFDEELLEAFGFSFTVIVHSFSVWLPLASSAMTVTL